ncbi:MAG: endonuclease/exonuclease/phosphatase family protein [Candidatus Omnitrophica bacterium]|nr:endonuclease/exonuclease/phosphatase family protein [Candidatus Omnitrophota bacterium]
MIPTILLSVSLILTIAGFFSQFGWWFDLASHFRVQYFFWQIFCVLLCIPKKRWKILSLALVAALVNFALIIPLYFPSANNKVAVPSQKISILLFNLNSYNDQFQELQEYIKEVNPDILALEEVNETWLSALTESLKEYPYWVSSARNDNFGIGLYSKIPVEDIQIIHFGSAGVPSVVAKYLINNKPTTLLFTHPVPPWNFRYYELRNEQLEDIASKRSFFDHNLILIGDLNTTSWSHQFSQFTKIMNLVDARKGFGIHVTWPTMWPWAGITIDHILVSPNIRVLDHKTGPDLGSDHYPVYTKLKIE